MGASWQKVAMASVMLAAVAVAVGQPPAADPTGPVAVSPRKRALGQVEDYRHDGSTRKNIPPAKATSRLASVLSRKRSMRNPAA